MSLSKEFPQIISVLKKVMSTRQAKAALRKVRRTSGEYQMDDDSNLGCVFVWRETPQGYNFWSKMHKKLRKRNDYSR